MEDFPRIAGEALAETRRLRFGTRTNRRGAWLAPVLFGLTILVAIPLYRIRIACQHGLRCGAQAGHAAAVAGVYVFTTSEILRLTYWSFAFILVFSATFAYHRRTNTLTGVRGKTKPMIRVGLFVFAFVLVAGGLVVPFSIRVGAFGTAPLLVIAASLSVLALYELRAGLLVLVGGYWVLAAFSLLYNDANALRRVHLGGPFTASWSLLPNLFIPGTYLVVGGLLLRHSGRRLLGLRQSGLCRG
jgi:hypothetical protein